MKFKTFWWLTYGMALVCMGVFCLMFSHPAELLLCALILGMIHAIACRVSYPEEYEPKDRKRGSSDDHEH